MHERTHLQACMRTPSWRHAHACVRLRACACACVHVRASMHVRTCACVHARTCMHMHVRACTCMHACMHACMHILSVNNPSVIFLLDYQILIVMKMQQDSAKQCVCRGKMGYSYILSYILLQCCYSFSYSISKQPQRCNFIITTDIYNNCSNRPAEVATFSGPMGYNKNRVFTTDIPLKKSTVCKHQVICRKLFSVVRIRLQSFATKLLVQVSDMLYHCCGECAKYYQIYVFTDVSYVNKSLMNSADILIPVIAKSSNVQEMFGFHFIPVFEVPSAYYFTLKESKRVMAVKLVMSCLNMWPLLVICLLMALISGFIAWFIERWKNVKEFPRPFLLGIIEGFWWSFVSMTTVGYGDKAPRSCPGRMFAVIWILIGITMCSIFTASLTSDIIDVRSTANPTIRGKLIGALKYRLHDSTLIAQHEGILRAIEFNNTVVGVVQLIKQLQRRHIDGFLISRATYYYYIRVIKENIKYKEYKESIANVQMIRTEKFYLGNKLVAGMLIKNREVYEYFKTYFEYNWLQIQGCYAYNLNYKDKKFNNDMYSPYEGLFYPFLYGSLGILGVIICSGVLYETRNYFVKRRTIKSTSNVKENVEHDCEK